MKNILIILLLFLGSFVFGNEQSILDEKQQLEWQDDVEHVELKLKLAKGYCSQMSLNGFTDWRIPSKKELVNLFQNKKLKQKFTYLQDAVYWTKTDDEKDDLNAYTIYSANAYISVSDKCDKNFIMCVRDH
ncbi:DUF1566 domain-containing protein [Sulfurimonas paralvinellae]|uniref:DUF1566 domain-containing protein n=1 Tax=Sulfurimonas paralvinellae TaxID=317658 RepID=A0A7M1B7B1_9BACT|nr:DUF1566 domain-containing protein [Sulfurimonas paralvinellae]QOP45593.1 DUF1566 domain-containing protein [Sulfurimonas paralvinellae]